MTAKGKGVDRLAVLQRGMQNRAVKNRAMHEETAEPVGLEAVPAPYAPREVDHLDDSERADLVTCEQAVAGLQRALAVAGKALATIRTARLYRETHSTFELYVEDRWGMKRAHAYRLIDAWPVAAALAPIGDIPEGQVRELVPAAKRHGVAAAVEVYTGLRDRGVKVTAARLRDAVRVLPPRLSEPEQARRVVVEAVRTGRIPSQSETTQADVDQAPAEGKVIVGELVEDSGTRAVALLARTLEVQKRLYDDLGDGVVAEALLAEPGRAEYLLRELRQYAKRTVHRIDRGLATDADAG
ncbi:hypothetical protein [Streptomyces griseoluteus]|uniref:hypothetical protein n=1 Tax=Streptomyces griseoluteus TaxID=29306 RepID=UPI0033258BC9